METSVRGNLNWVAFILSFGGAAALVASAMVFSKAYQAKTEQVRKAEQILNVTGSARKRIRSDLAVWKIQASGSGKDLKLAFAVLKQASDRVSKFLEARKFNPAEISIGAIDTQTHSARDKMGNQSAEIEQYTLSRTFTITSARIDDVSTQCGQVTELIQDGLNVQSYPPQYHYTKLSELKIEMLGDATRDARTRGQNIATNAGCAITDIRNARMGVLQITPPNSTEVSDSGINDTTSIEKDVMSVVALTFGIETR